MNIWWRKGIFVSIEVAKKALHLVLHAVTALCASAFDLESTFFFLKLSIVAMCVKAKTYLLTLQFKFLQWKKKKKQILEKNCADGQPMSVFTFSANVLYLQLSGNINISLSSVKAIPHATPPLKLYHNFH